MAISRIAKQCLLALILYPNTSFHTVHRLDRANAVSFHMSPAINKVNGPIEDPVAFSSTGIYVQEKLI